MSPLSITRFLAILCCAGMLQLGFVEIIEAQSIPQLPRPDIGNPGGQGAGTQQGSGRQGKPRRPRPGIQGADMSTDKSENKIGKFEELLENKDLSRFRGYKQTAVPSGWKMDGKNVHFDGSGGGDMVTVDEYDNFELQFDWKISAGGNSGVMYRVSLGDNAPYFSGPEYQVLDNDKHADGKNELTSAGALYAMYPPSEKRARKVGIWNTTKIIVNGNKIVHYLNGTRIVEAEIGSDDWNSRLGKSKFNSWEKFAKNISGHIAFQDHGNEVWFRKIRIKRLQPSAMASSNNQRGSTNFGQNNGPGGLAPPSLGGNRGGPPAGVGDRGGRGSTPPAAGGGNSRQMSNGKSRRPRPNFKPAESGFESGDDKKAGDDRGGRDNGPGGLAPPSLGGQPAGVGNRGGSTRQMSNGKSRRPRPNFKPAESGFETEDDKKGDKKEDAKDNKDN
ncbi:MAG: DUF1080 domain-containing protein [Mariniblastus sp.]|nr:DUF1080 domain-containing protein [Mariniblastus sp.]